jgi:hypothetical protein
MALPVITDAAPSTALRIRNARRSSLSRASSGAGVAFVEGGGA